MSRLGFVRRAVPWPVVGITAIPPLALVLASFGFAAQGWAPAARWVGLLLLVAPAAYVFDDPAAAVVRATQRSPRWCHASRTLALLPTVAVLALVALPGGDLVAGPGWGQRWALVLVGGTCVVGTAAGAAVAHGLGRAAPGELVSACAVGAVLAVLLFRPGWHDVQLLPPPGGASRADVVRWAVLLALGLLTLAWAPGRIADPPGRG